MGQHVTFTGDFPPGSMVPSVREALRRWAREFRRVVDDGALEGPP